MPSGSDKISLIEIKLWLLNIDTQHTFSVVPQSGKAGVSAAVYLL